MGQGNGFPDTDRAPLEVLRDPGRGEAGSGLLPQVPGDLKGISLSLQILRELKALVWIFLVQNIPEVAYLFYLLYTVRGLLAGWRIPFHVLLEGSLVPEMPPGALFLMPSLRAFWGPS